MAFETRRGGGSGTSRACSGDARRRPTKPRPTCTACVRRREVSTFNPSKTRRAELRGSLTSATSKCTVVASPSPMRPAISRARCRHAFSGSSSSSSTPRAARSSSSTPSLRSRSKSDAGLGLAAIAASKCALDARSFCFCASSSAIRLTRASSDSKRPPVITQAICPEARNWPTFPAFWPGGPRVRGLTREQFASLLIVPDRHAPWASDRDQRLEPGNREIFVLGNRRQPVFVGSGRTAGQLLLEAGSPVMIRDQQRPATWLLRVRLGYQHEGKSFGIGCNRIRRRGQPEARQQQQVFGHAQMKNRTRTGDGENLVEAHSWQQAQQRVVADHTARSCEFSTASARCLAQEPSSGDGAADDRAVPQLSHRLTATVQVKNGLDRQHGVRGSAERVKVELSSFGVIHVEVAWSLQIGK